MEKLKLLYILGLLYLFDLVQGQEMSPSTASIVGFAVVLSFLIISLCIVVVLCVCFGKCRLPCKPVAPLHEELESGSRHRSNRELIPQPDKRPTSLTNSSSVQSSDRQPRQSSVPPSMSVPLALMTTPQVQRMQLNTVSQNPQEVVEIVSALPTSASSNKVVHLSQLNAESFKKFAKNNTGPPPNKPKGSSIEPRPKPSHQRKYSDQSSQRKRGAARPQNRSDMNPESVIPYQPQKSPFTPREFSPVGRNVYSYPPRTTIAPPNIPIPYLSNARYPPAESPVADRSVCDDISTSAANEITQPTKSDSTDNISKHKSPPPAYTTVV